MGLLGFRRVARFNKRFREWPESAKRTQTPKELFELYSAGYAGAYVDPEEAEALESELQFASYGEAVAASGAEHRSAAAAGGLYLPFLNVVRCEAERLGIQGTDEELSADERIKPWDEKQGTGDCTSHGDRGRYDNTRANEIASGEPEAWVCRTATEPTYGMRGHGGQGMNPATATRIKLQFGNLLRKVHDVPGYGKLDLSSYNPKLGMNWGAKGGTPKAILEIGKPNKLDSAAPVKSVDEAVQAFRDGRVVGGGSDVGFSSTRDENGVSELNGSWAHDMYHHGCDERPETISLYGGRLFLIQNSWWKWNGGPRRIRGTNILIPHGAFWVREKAYRRLLAGSQKFGWLFAFRGVAGWAPLRLPDLGATGIV